MSGFGDRGTVESSQPDSGADRPGLGHYRTEFLSDWLREWLKRYEEEERAREREEEKEEEETVEKVPKFEVDLQRARNRLDHHSDRYGNNALVIRRGWPMFVKVKLNREFKDTDKLKFIFHTGTKPQPSKGTLDHVFIEREKSSFDKHPMTDWAGCVESVKTESGESEVTVKVRPAVDCPVGRYKLIVNYYTEYRGKTRKYSNFSETDTADKKDEDIFIIFNAFCKDDQVYLENKEEREEYVMNETGRIFVGSGFWPSSRPWVFGQFSQFSLKAAIKVLEESDPEARSCGNPTKVCRILSGMVNKSGFTDKGILVGNWSGDYEGGKSPVSWTGTPAILQQYVETGRPVKYGQCWVFSGITTTLGRTLGIPTRTVTNFDSAHDHDESMTIDKHFDEEGEPLTNLDDSIWNFHVWNESWFKRPDLPDGFDGWQAYDATPQELSEGEMQCGPAPVKAIKEGNIYLNYDCKFIFGEVNGDELNWTVNKDGSYTLREVVEFSSVGSKTSTKAVGSNNRNDIQYDYKYIKGSPMAKAARERAYRFTNAKKMEDITRTFKHVEQDVEFQYESDINEKGDVMFQVTAKNLSDEKRTVKLRVTTRATYYTGIAGEKIMSEAIVYTLKPREENNVQTWSLKATQYWSKVDEDAMLKAYVFAKVTETDQTFIRNQPFTFKKPNIDLKVSTDAPKAGETFSLVCRTYNPLDQELHRAQFTVEGPGIQKERVIPLNRTIRPHESIEETISLTPKYGGNREIVVVFHSKELVNLTGAVNINVAEA